MKLNRSRPFAVALSLAAAAVVFAADTKPKKPAAPAAKPAAPAPAAPAAAATPAATPAAKPAPGPKDNEVLATVNGEEIKRGEVEGVIRDVLISRQQPPDSLPPAEKDNAVRQVVDSLVMERIMKKATTGVTVTDAEIDGEITKIKEQRKMTDAEIAKKLAEAGKTIDTLKKDIREGLTQKKWFDEQFKGKVNDATEADAKDFYDKNAKEFESPETMRASHILFMLKPDATPEQVAAAKKKADAATVRAQKEDFAKLASELSEEPGAKERGGDLNFFGRGQMVPEFSDAAFKLKTGEVTKEPVRSQFGYHVIKATDHKEAAKQAFDEVKKDLTAYLTKDKKQKAAQEIVAKLKEAAKIDIKLPPPPAPPADAQQIPPEILEQLQKAQQAQEAQKKGAKAPVEAVTPPVSVPAETPKK